MKYKQVGVFKISAEICLTIQLKFSKVAEKSMSVFTLLKCTKACEVLIKEVIMTLMTHFSLEWLLLSLVTNKGN